MNENLKRHRPDIMVLGEGKALAIMQEDPMGVWCHIQEVRDLLDVKDKELAFLRKHLESMDNLVKEHKDLLLESQKMHLKCANNASTQILRLTRYIYLILADLHASKAQEYARASLVCGTWLDENDKKQCYRKEKCAARCREIVDKLGE